MKYLIIVPVHQSENTILAIWESLQKIAPNHDVLFINRGSSDSTEYLLLNNDIPHLTFPVSSNYLDALKLGMLYAVKNNYDAAIEWNDNNIFNPDDIEYFTKTLINLKIDFVLGKRFNKAPKSMRWFGTRTLRRVIRISSGRKVTDPTMRFRAYSKRVMKVITSNRDYYPSIETIAHLLRVGYTFKEINTSLINGAKKQSNLSNWGSFKQIGGWALEILFSNPFKRKVRKHVK